VVKEIMEHRVFRPQNVCDLHGFKCCESDNPLSAISPVESLKLGLQLEAALIDLPGFAAADSFGAD